MTPRLRVLVVPKWYPWPERPVFGIFCREHARALALRHDVVVLASLATPSPPFRIFDLADGQEDGLRTMRVRYRRPRLRPLALACQAIGMLAALRRLRLEGWRPGIVHAHVYSAGLPALLLGAVSRAPVVITEHFTGFQRGMVTGYERLLARLAFEGADLVAPVSQELAGHLRAIAPRARMRVLPNVVDTEVFAPPQDQARAGGGPARLLTVGTLTDKKGHAYLLDALGLLGDGQRLDVVGDGELRARLEARARDLGLAERVTFRGELPKQEVAALMRAADLFVLPSTHETFGCVLIEAMASGLPAVATRVGGVPEVLVPAAGELVPARDPRALADAIGRALDRHFDAAALRSLAVERYGYQAFAERWSEAYDELPPRSRGRTSSAITARTRSSA